MWITNVDNFSDLYRFMIKLNSKDSVSSRVLELTILRSLAPHQPINSLTECQHVILALSRVPGHNQIIQIGDARQTGRTSGALALAIRRALEEPYARIAYLTYNYANSRFVLERVKLALNQLQVSYATTANGVVLNNGAELKFTPQEHDALRGCELSLLVVDDVRKSSIANEIRNIVLPMTHNPEFQAIFVYDN
jgi:hypothetical protein